MDSLAAQIGAWTALAVAIATGIGQLYTSYRKNRREDSVTAADQFNRIIDRVNLENQQLRAELAQERAEKLILVKLNAQFEERLKKAEGTVEAMSAKIKKD